MAESRVVYAYLSEDAPLKRKSGLPKGLQYAVVSREPIAASKISRVFPKTRAVRLRELPESDVREKGAVRVRSAAYEPDVRARALLRGVRLVEEDLRSSGGAYSLDQVQELMHGITRQAVNNRVRDGSLLVVPGPSNRAAYPVVQFTPDGSVVPGLKSVREALGTTNGWMLLNFLVNPEPRLRGRKPIDVLKAGDVEKVVEAARRASVQGA